MQVVESHQGLFGYLPNHRHRYTTVIVLLDHCQEVLTQHLKGHHRVPAIRSNMEELVIHLQVMCVRLGHFKLGLPQILPHRLLPFRVFEVIGNLIEDFFLFHRALCVLICGLLDLHCVQILVL